MNEHNNNRKEKSGTKFVAKSKKKKMHRLVDHIALLKLLNDIYIPVYFA